MKFILIYSFGHFLKTTKVSKRREHSLWHILRVFHITGGNKVAFG